MKLMNKSPESLARLAAIIIVAVLALAFSIALIQQQHYKLQEQESGKIRPDVEYEAFAAANGYILRHLTSPASAKFPSADSAVVEITYVGDDTYWIYSYVDSENLYGVTIRNWFDCRIKREAGAWRLVELDFYDRTNQAF